MSAQNQEAEPTGPSGTDRPVYDTIDYVFDQGTEGNVAANDDIHGSDFTSRISEHGFETDSNEVLEVFRMEYIPALTGSGRLHTVDSIRLRGDGDDVRNLRYREFMMGFFGQDFQLSTPPLGVPVLSGVVNPDANPFATSTIKFGPSTDITPVLNNDGTPIDDSFTIRLHTMRWKGTDAEFRDYFQAIYGSTVFRQNIRMSNPFTGSVRTYNRADPIVIRPESEDSRATGGAKSQFTKFTGGFDQELPKVWPWVTWADNNQVTTANNDYKFDQALDNVDEPWKELEFDFTDKKEAVQFNYTQVTQPPSLLQGSLHIDERDEQPFIKLPATSRHQLPVVRPPDGSKRTIFGRSDLPVAFGTALDPAGRRIGANLLGGKQTIWDDGGGFRIRDNGNTIAANNVLIGVQGRRMELTS